MDQTSTGAVEASPTSADASADSSPAPDELSAESMERSIGKAQDGLRAKRQAAKKPEADAAAPEQATPEEGKDAQKEPDVVPMSAFKARIGKLSSKLEAAEGKYREASFENTRLKSALEIANQEISRLTEARQRNAPYDDKEEIIRSHEVEREARARFDQIQKEHERQIQETQQQAKFESVVESLEAEIEDAVSQHSLVTQQHVIDYMLRNQNVKSAREAARLVEDALIEKGKEE